MPYLVRRRAGLLIPFNDTPHLFAVMNDPGADDLCLLLMVSSIKPNRAHDPACILRAGDHEFLQHDSYVVYRLAQTTRATHIGNMVDSGYYKERPAFGDAVFGRIIQGIWESAEISPSMERFAASVC